MGGINVNLVARYGFTEGEKLNKALPDGLTIDLMWRTSEGNKFRDNSISKDAGLGRILVILIILFTHAIKQGGQDNIQTRRTFIDHSFQYS